MAHFTALTQNAGTTDSDTQVEQGFASPTSSSVTMRRGLVAAFVGVALILAAGVAIMTVHFKAERQWLGQDIESKAYGTDADTGCSDWEKVMIGSMQTATSDLDCLNKCLNTSGAMYANFQADKCDAYNGAHEGACYCFSDCSKIANSCWDLIATGAAVITTMLSEPVAAGASSVNVGSQEGFTVGSKATISGGGNSETKTIVGFASMLLDSPLQYSYPAGSTVSAEAPTTASPDTSVTPEPSASITTTE